MTKDAGVLFQFFLKMNFQHPFVFVILPMSDMDVDDQQGPPVTGKIGSSKGSVNNGHMVIVLLFIPTGLEQR